MDVLGLISVEQMNEVARRAWAATNNHCAAVAQCNELPTHFLYYLVKGYKVRRLTCADHAQQAAAESGLPIKQAGEIANYYTAVAS
jgi:hypothetical protein